MLNEKNGPGSFYNLYTDHAIIQLFKVFLVYQVDIAVIKCKNLTWLPNPGGYLISTFYRNKTGVIVQDGPV